MRNSSLGVDDGRSRLPGGARLRPRYLIVDDNALVAGAIARVLRKFGDATVVGTVEAALRVLAERHRWSAFFLDITLPDGSGLDVLAHARALYPGTPALVLTGDAAPATINGAYDLDADFCAKPFDARRVVRFVQSSSESFAARLTCTIAAWTARYALSEAESDVLLRAAQGARRRAIAQARATTELTVKAQIRRLLEKVGDDHLHAAVERILREATGL